MIDIKQDLFDKLTIELTNQRFVFNLENVDEFIIYLINNSIEIDFKDLLHKPVKKWIKQHVSNSVVDDLQAAVVHSKENDHAVFAGFAINDLDSITYLYFNKTKKNKYYSSYHSIQEFEQSYIKSKIIAIEVPSEFINSKYSGENRDRVKLSHPAISFFNSRADFSSNDTYKETVIE